MPVFFYTTIKTPVGFLELKSDEESLVSVGFVNQQNSSSTELPDIIDEAAKQLHEYFKGERKFFDLNINPEGTLFQHKIWDLVKNVPYGTTVSYLDIARFSGNEKNTRAVGMANGKNPLPIIIPCHRVIGHAGKLTGYAGGLEKKQWLLHLELQHEKPAGLLF